MSVGRSFVCLECGRSVTVSAEEYRLLKDNPICNECKNKREKIKEEKTQPNDVLNTVLKLSQKAVSVISDKLATDKTKTSDTVKSSKKTTKNVFDSVSSFVNVQNDLPNDEFVCDLSKWKHIGCLGELYDNGKLSAWSHSVGLYMHKIDGKIMYIGRAVEYNNGGFRKRLSDYCRANGSARKHPSGQKIYANRYRIQTHILVVGNDEEAAEKSKRLEELYVGKFNPPWNSKLKTSD